MQCNIAILHEEERLKARFQIIQYWGRIPFPNKAPLFPNKAPLFANNLPLLKNKRALLIPNKNMPAVIFIYLTDILAFIQQKEARA